MISVKNLSASYGKTKVLENFCLEMDKGQSYALIGPSGCGKSTFLKILSGIHKDYSGEIIIDGESFSQKKLKIGYVPQAYGLLDWKTVKENILLPVKLTKSIHFNETEAADIIKTLEIEDLLNRYPLQLSGGQRQRVALARAFIYQPDLLLMDEPFSSLDSFTSARSQKLYLQLWRKYNITTLFVTHNILESVSLCEHIMLMSKQSGNIIQNIENKTLRDNNKSNQLSLVNNIMTLFEEVIA